VPLGTAEGRPQPQALEYLNAHSRGVEVKLDDVDDDLVDLARELDALESTEIINQFRAQLRNWEDPVSLYDVGRALEGLATKQADPAVRDTVALVATRLLKYVRR
jgi:hypothetical protein